VPVPLSRTLLAKVGSFLGIAIGVTGIVFVTRTLINKWAEVQDAFSQVEAINLVVSLALGLTAMTVIGSIWVTMLASRSHQVRHRVALSWYFTGQLGKYVPGGIWPIVGRAELAARNNIPRVDAYASTGLSLVSTYLAAIVAIAIGALATSGHRIIGIIISAFLAVGFAVFSNEKLRIAIVSIASRISPAAQSLTDPVRLAKLVLMHLPAWVLMSLSTSVTAQAFGANIGVAEMLFITSTSWLIGFVIIGVPGGIGVREAVFTSLAGGIVGVPMAVSLALLSRVVFIAVDLSGALASNLIARASRSVKS
jgi:hypothetical protein